MGFKATDWAYGLQIAPATKAVLLALAHRADDKTFECFPGQQELANMTGASIRTVSRALNELEANGVIARRQRRRPGGSRTSDLCVLNRFYQSQGHVTESHVTESQETQRPNSPDSVSELTGQRVRHIEDEQPGEHPEDQSDSRSIDDDFSDFYQSYPRKQGRADAMKAYRAARKTTDAEVILNGARAYNLLTAGKEREYIKLPAGWLRDRRWEDDPIAQTASKDVRALAVVEMGHRPADRPMDRFANTAAECPQHPGYPADPCARCGREAIETPTQPYPTADPAELDPLGGNPF